MEEICEICEARKAVNTCIECGKKVCSTCCWVQLGICKACGDKGTGAIK